MLKYDFQKCIVSKRTNVKVSNGLSLFLCVIKIRRLLNIAHKQLIDFWARKGYASGALSNYYTNYYLGSYS